MMLYENWKQLLRKAWSIRLMILAFIFTGLEVALPLLSESIPNKLFAVLSGFAVAGAFVSRLVVQKDMQ